MPAALQVQKKLVANLPQDREQHNKHGGIDCISSIQPVPLLPADRQAAAWASVTRLHHHTPAALEVHAAPRLLDSVALVWQVRLVVLSEAKRGRITAQHRTAVTCTGNR
jgi:hypothetical protein